MKHLLIWRCPGDDRGRWQREDGTGELRQGIWCRRGGWGGGTVGASSSDAVEFHSKITNIVVALIC